MRSAIIYVRASAPTTEPRSSVVHDGDISSLKNLPHGIYAATDPQDQLWAVYVSDDQVRIGRVEGKTALTLKDRVERDSSDRRRAALEGPPPRFSCAHPHRGGTPCHRRRRGARCSVWRDYCRGSLPRVRTARLGPRAAPVARRGTDPALGPGEGRHARKSLGQSEGPPCRAGLHCQSSLGAPPPGDVNPHEEGLGALKPNDSTRSAWF